MDAKEKIIIQNVRTLIDELDPPQAYHAKQNQQDMALNEVVKQLVMMACLNYWVYDSLTSQVTFYSLDEDLQKTRAHVRSLAYLLHKLDDKGREDMLQAISDLMEGHRARAEVIYTYMHNDHCDCFDVVLQSMQVNETRFIVGITRSFAKSEHHMRINVAAQKKFELFMNIANTFIWEYDVIDDVFIANHALCEKLLIEERPYKMTEINDIIHVNMMELFHCQPKSLKTSKHSTIQLQDACGEQTFIFETCFNALQNDAGDDIFVLGTLTDITEKELFKAKASRDDLTQCFNRRTADITLASSFRRYREEGEFYTIIFLDVDDFKLVNDHYGHDAGDYVLAHFSAQIQREIRSSDMLFRWGGDEFLLICSGIAKENIYAYVDRLRRVIETSAFEYGKEHIQVTTSIGAAYYYPADKDYLAAMKRADRSVYKSKLAGRNKVCILK